MSELDTTPEDLSADLDRARWDFYQLLSLVDADEWDKPTTGTRWTNEQLLFHMVFGYMVVQSLLVLVRLFGRLPQRVSHAFAQTLNAATRPFDTTNFHGTNMAARLFNRKRMGHKLDRVLDALQRSLSRENAQSLHRGMHFPTRWDPYFRDYMTLADVYAYPGKHYDHHRQQLCLAKLGQARRSHWRANGQTEDIMTKPTVLFLCTHNAGRSQMAMGFFAHHAGDQATVYSGGSEPADQVNPAAVAAMAEKGIDITTEYPKRWTHDMLEAADVVVTMGCGDTCPVLPGRRYEEWLLPDPAGQPLEAVRPIRDEIDQRVRTLLAELGVGVRGGG
jgi:protein-tyrosine-phosphatase